MLAIRLNKVAVLVVVVSVLGAGCLVTIRVIADEKSSKAESSSSSDAEKIKDLQKERLDLLQKLLAQVTAHYKAGVIPFSAVAQAERDYLKASIDVEDDREKRITILKKIQENADQAVRIADGMFKNGLVTESD